MASIQVSRLSRYIGTDLYRVFDQFGYPTNNYYFGVWRRPVASPDLDGDVDHTVKEHEIGRLDLLAYQYYGDPLLWWVIADANSMMDQFTEMVPGEVLTIPSLDAVERSLENARRSK